MTAEVAILNRTAVALAADSAVTIGQKTYTSENKIFELSRTKPIGLMIYNTLDFYGHPWEVLIKDFRTARGEQDFTSVSEWSQAFVDWMYKERKPSDVNQNEQFEAVVREIVTELNDRIEEKPLTLRRPKEQKERFRKFMLDYIEELERVPRADNRIKLTGAKTEAHAVLQDETTLTACISRQSATIFAIAEEMFGPLDDEEKAHVKNAVFTFLSKRRLSSFHTGLVFAGFGKADNFPALHHIVIDGVFGDQLRCFEIQYYQVGVSSDDGGTVLAFAQPEVTDRFLNGVDDEMEERILAHFIREIKGLKTELAVRAGIAKRRLKALQEALNQSADSVLKRYREKTSGIFKKRFFSQTEGMVRLMPKQEMADFAEALVNITIIKGRASSELGTVDGPIDVAVVSRHEGFVWIKRKHYFDPKLNARYFWREFGQWLPKSPAG